jgi:hypothetical protein
MRQNVFIGYSKKPPQKGPRIILVIAVILLIGYVVYWSEKNPPQPATSTSSTTIVKVSSTVIPKPSTPTTIKPVEAPKKIETPKTETKPAVIEPSANTQIIYNELCRNITDSYEPINAGDNFTGAGQIYFLNRIRSKTVPNNLSHVWITPSGRIKAQVPLVMTRNESSTWSYVSVSDSIEYKGKWTVRVVDSQGKTILERTFQFN